MWRLLPCPILPCGAGPLFTTRPAGRQHAVLSSLPTARLAQSVEHETLNLRVVGSSPTLGATLFLFFFFFKLPLIDYVLSAENATTDKGKTTKTSCNI